MRSRCAGCGNLRRQVLPAWPSCKRARLCKLVDRAIVDRSPCRHIDVYSEINRHLTLGHQQAVAHVGRAPFPESPTEFRELCLTLHRLIFEIGQPAFAGRFRRAGEASFFGGEREHLLTGARAESIPTDLDRSWPFLGGCDLKTVDRGELVNRMARFLEAFFFVHPFVDGNGRVARLVLLRAVSETGRWEIRFPKGRKEQRRYVFALQQAHRDVPANGNVARRAYLRNPVWLLARWLDRCLEERPENLDEIPPG